MRSNVVQDGSLDAAEAEIIGIALDLDPRKAQGVPFTKFEAIRFNLPCNLINHRSAGITETQETRNLVIGFASRIVPGASQAAVFESADCVLAMRCRRPNVVQQGVAAGDD